MCLVCFALSACFSLIRLYCYSPSEVSYSSSITGQSQYLWQWWRDGSVKTPAKCPTHKPVPRDKSASASSVPVTSGTYTFACFLLSVFFTAVFDI